jgi:hypothetical protein
MSEYSRFVAWESRCRDSTAYGMTAGDTFWGGLRDYTEPYPCPGSLALPGPGVGMDCEPYRRRIEKAKREIAESQSMNRVMEMAAALRPSVVKAFLKALNNGKS